MSLNEFGSSIPIVLDPGIVEILADSELVFLAISSERFTIFETLTPAAGSNSLRVTTGPVLIFVIFPCTPKSNNTFSKKSASTFFSSFAFLTFFSGTLRKSSDGSLKTPTFLGSEMDSLRLKVS